MVTIEPLALNAVEQVFAGDVMVKKSLMVKPAKYVWALVFVRHVMVMDGSLPTNKSYHLPPQ